MQDSQPRKSHTARNIVLAIVPAFIILVAIGAIAASFPSTSKSTSTTTFTGPPLTVSSAATTIQTSTISETTSTAPPVTSSSSSAAPFVTVTVNYTGAWQGAYGQVSSTQSWNANGSKSITLAEPSGTVEGFWIITANAQKQDNSSAVLSISIRAANGTVLAMANTTSPYGVAQVSTTAG